MKNKKLLTSTIIAIIGIPLIWYSAITAFKLDRFLVFEPDKTMKPVIKEFADKTEIKTFKSDNGLNISYWHIKGNNHKLPPILYCHGNAENLSFFQQKLVFLSNLGYDIYMLDYRGYGASDGYPTEQGVYFDTNQMIKHLKAQYDIDNNNLIIWGHSMGGGVVSEITSKMQFKAVILEATFTKLEDMKNYAAEFRSSNKFEEILRKVIYSLIPMTQKFENINKIDKINSPLLVLHSKPDDIVPYEMSVELVKHNKHASLYISDVGDHDDPYWHNDVILDFITRLK